MSATEPLEELEELVSDLDDVAMEAHRRGESLREPALFAMANLLWSIGERVNRAATELREANGRGVERFDSADDAARRYWRRRAGATDEEARDPRPFKDVLADRRADA